MLHWSWPWMSEPDKRRTLGCSPTWMTLHSWRDSSHSGTDKPQSELWTPWMAQPQGCQVNVPKDHFSCTIFSTYRRLYRRLCYRRLQYCLSTCIKHLRSPWPGMRFSSRALAYCETLWSSGLNPTPCPTYVASTTYELSLQSSLIPVWAVCWADNISDTKN